MRATWSRVGSDVALQIVDLPEAARADLAAMSDAQFARAFPVYAASVAAADYPPAAPSTLQPLPGRYSAAGREVCFVPRFPFLPGTTYTVLVHRDLLTPAGGQGTSSFDREDYDARSIAFAPDPGEPVTSVVEIYPTAREVPRNLLRLYVEFSAPMAEGGIERHVHLRPGGDGPDLEGAFLPMDAELWDPDRRRVTLMLDPARIKRGLAPHQEAGYALTPGTTVEVVVDAELRDAMGRALTAARTRRYLVGPDVREHVDPCGWEVVPPARATADPLVLRFPRPLDHALLLHCIGVTAGGAPVAGTVSVSDGERQWAFTPSTAWSDRGYEIVVDPILEDLAGNSLTRVFDRDLDVPAHAPRPHPPVVLTFAPS